MKSILHNATGFDVSKLLKRLSSLLSSKFDRGELERLLLLEESRIGAEIFGSRKSGYRRDFFMLDEHTWVWNEQVDTPNGSHIVTTRYIIDGDKVYKTQDGGSYVELTGEELRNLYEAVRLYSKKVRGMYATL